MTLSSGIKNSRNYFDWFIQIFLQFENPCHDDTKRFKFPLGKLVKHMILLGHVMNKGSDHRASLLNSSKKQKLKKFPFYGFN